MTGKETWMRPGKKKANKRRKKKKEYNRFVQMKIIEQPQECIPWWQGM